MLLALLLLGILGLTIELFLLEHTESTTQLIPFVTLGLGLFAVLAVAVRPTRRSVRFFQLGMGALIAAGVLGLVLHYRGNVEFELEMQPSAHGLDLIWKSLTGATPALAPGAMAQLGLLGLIYAYRHPALRRDPARAST